MNLSGGSQDRRTVVVTVVLRKGKMTDHQMLRPDVLFNELAALSQGYPGEVQQSQVNVPHFRQKIRKFRSAHGTVTG